MRDLWGEQIPPQQTKRQTPTRSTAISLTAQDCLLYGRSFTPAGMNGEKVCTVCSVKGYCPGCIPIVPSNAQPFYCTRHTPESRVQA